MGVLSALPIISVGNVCCCLWVISGGVVASYLLQQNQPEPITPGDGALVGLLAGLAGAVIYLALSIPLTILLAPMERAFMARLADMAGTVRPEVRSYLATGVGAAIGIVVGFMFMLFFGSIFSTLGGVLGAAIFRRNSPTTQIIDSPPLP
jgi:hypothetical protein